jgi:hypothetical protein
MSKVYELLCMDPDYPSLKAIETDLGSYIVEGRTFANFNDLQTHLRSRTPKYMIGVELESDQDTDD